MISMDAVDPLRADFARPISIPSNPSAIPGRWTATVWLWAGPEGPVAGAIWIDPNPGNHVVKIKGNLAFLMAELYSG